MPGYVYKGNEPLTPRKPHKPRSGRPSAESWFDPTKCGERAGYAQHRRHGQEPCQPCRRANAAYSKDYKRKGSG